MMAISNDDNNNNNNNMMSRFLMVVVCLLVPVAFGQPDCFSSTQVLYEAMLRADSSIETTYVICPNTVIDVGFSDDDTGGCCVDGDYSLFLRSRSTVQCGYDGKSENNCVLRGGGTQLFYSGAIFEEDIAVGVKVIGLTFESSTLIAVAAATRGDIAFQNCIWKNHTAAGTIFLAYSRPSERRLLDMTKIDRSDPHAVAKLMMTRSFQEEWYQSVIEEAGKTSSALDDGLSRRRRRRRRRLQQGFVQLVRFENCQFLENRQGDPNQAGISIYGVILAITPYNPMVIRNSIFQGNIYDGSDGQQQGYAVQSVGSQVSIYDTCFFNNSFIGYGPVQILADAAFKSSGNFVTEDDLVICQFIASSSALIPDGEDEVTCYEAEAESCQVSDPTETPIDNLPTMSPTFDGNFTYPDCFTSTFDILLAMIRANSFVETTYVICPNTVIEIGNFDDAGDCCVDGDYLMFLRSRSIIKCGEDGRSQNNCVLRGGNTHMFVLAGIFDEIATQGVRIIGMTFEGAELASLAGAGPGDVTFEDCTWKNHVGGVVIVLANTGNPDAEDEDTTRNLNEAASRHSDQVDVAKHVMSRNFQEKWFQGALEKARHSFLAHGSPKIRRSRALQGSSTLLTSFFNCTFTGNVGGGIQTDDFPFEAIIVSLSELNPIIIRDSLFQENIYGDSDGISNGCAIQSIGAQMDMSETCFVNNSFVGFGPVQLFAAAEYELANNYATDDSTSYCTFAAVSESFIPETFSDVTCIASDLDACGRDSSPPPSPIDTEEPSASPSTTTESPTSAESTIEPSGRPSMTPNIESGNPSVPPSSAPVEKPSASPSTESEILTSAPSNTPSFAFTKVPSAMPSVSPKRISDVPSEKPSSIDSLTTNPPSVTPPTAQMPMPSKPPVVIRPLGPIEFGPRPEKGSKSKNGGSKNESPGGKWPWGKRH